MKMSAVLFTILVVLAVPAMATDRTYAQVVDDLTKASKPLKELHGKGSVAITLASGRVVGFAFSKDGANLLWTNPKLSETAKVATVAFTTATYGINVPGTVYRMDDVPIPLRPAFESPYWSDYDVLKGMDVFTRDGDKIGTFKSIYHPNLDFEQSLGRHYFLLDPGMMKDWFGGLDKTYIPETAIQGMSDNGVFLNLTEDQIKNRTWEAPVDLKSYRVV